MARTIPRLGSLEERPLRDAWEHEALNFTPWLAEHLPALSAVIELPLELEGQEVPVEGFKADILARCPADDTRVLIENQLEGSDHGHLGQILTYMAGLEVKTVVWVAASFRDAHISAIDWLNEHTSDDFAFFAVQVRVVRIADSPLAPIFEVKTRPNRFERSLAAAARKATGEATPTGERRRAFWTAFLERHPEHAVHGPAGAGSWRRRKVQGAPAAVSLYLSEGTVGVYLGPHKNGARPELMTALRANRAALEAALGVEMGGDDAQFPFTSNAPLTGDDPESRARAADWLNDNAERYAAVIKDVLGADDEGGAV
ncbi:MAG: hypothetical protein RIA71_07605 [Oceanicaulis sp.]